jgi:NADPH:quinone reductase-like Zn-dependent oxidoreductase
MGDNIVGGPRQQRMLISRRGGPEELTLMDEPMPSPVRISFAYASLRQGSLVPMCEGLYTGIPSYPFAPGHDVVGEIDAFGPGAGAGLLAGQRVEALTVAGGYVRSIVVSEDDCVPVSDMVLYQRS